MGTQDRILRAAGTTFGRYGFRQTNMELIAQEAGVSRQALYRYFTSKEALFSTLVEELHHSALEAAEAAVVTANRAGEPLDEVLFAQLDARFTTFMERLEESPHADELIEENAQLAAGVASRYADLLRESVARVIRTAVAVDSLGLVRDLPADHLARLIIAAARGLKDTRPAPRLEDFRTDLRRMISLLVAGALATEEPATTRRR